MVNLSQLNFAVSWGRGSSIVVKVLEYPPSPRVLIQPRLTPGRRQISQIPLN